MAIEVSIYPAPEAERLARPLIEKHHRDLLGARILFLMTTQERRRLGRTVLGTAQKLRALQRYLSSGDKRQVAEGADFLILLADEPWRHLTDAQRSALLDHELSHCVAGRNGWALRGHSLEEFSAVVERHGLWKSDVREMADAIAQLRLPLEAPVGAAR